MENEVLHKREGDRRGNQNRILSNGTLAGRNKTSTQSFSQPIRKILIHLWCYVEAEPLQTLCYIK